MAMVSDVLMWRLLRDILVRTSNALWDTTDKRFLVLPVCTVPDKGSKTKRCIYKGEEYDRVLGPPSLVAYRAALLKKNRGPGSFDLYLFPVEVEGGKSVRTRQDS